MFYYPHFICEESGAQSSMQFVQDSTASSREEFYLSGFYTPNLGFSILLIIYQTECLISHWSLGTFYE